MKLVIIFLAGLKLRNQDAHAVLAGKVEKIAGNLTGPDDAACQVNRFRGTFYADVEYCARRKNLLGFYEKAGCRDILGQGVEGAVSGLYADLECFLDPFEEAFVRHMYFPVLRWFHGKSVDGLP